MEYAARLCLCFVMVLLGCGTALSQAPSAKVSSDRMPQIDIAATVTTCASGGRFIANAATHCRRGRRRMGQFSFPALPADDC